MPKTAKRKSKNKKRAKGESRRKGLTLEPHQVIIKPLVTEKGVFQSQNLNQYTFQVNPLATKTEIRHAIETLFEVKIARGGISTQTRKGKPRRYRFRFGRTKDWKKAIVKLAGDDKIDFF
ncbi:MAG: 50S ribosomal protein L23 [Planctomycetota bacterium]